MIAAEINVTIRAKVDNAMRTFLDRLECRFNGTLRQSQDAIFIGESNEDREVLWNVSDLFLRLHRGQELIPTGSAIGLTFRENSRETCTVGTNLF